MGPEDYVQMGALAAARAAGHGAEAAQRDRWREMLRRLGISLAGAALRLRDAWELPAASLALDTSITLSEALLGPAHATCMDAVVALV
ncbi:hypothetical protein HaLaN_21725 [Haematococcus lacustris]|uniref:Uncharacterized protein n=1 Tax=Haematococcus lacustris TaxID=44745 RepID=A0A699ZMW1_HAELA|nr:hypothetical protein HaLaN_21725 [Haematococcus lacustris]